MKKQQPKPKPVAVGNLKKIVTTVNKSGDTVSIKKPFTSTSGQKLGTLTEIRKPVKVGGSLGNIHTGSAKTHPGVLKAQADKRKADSIILSKKKK